jgi:hypothetical protein
MEQGGVMARMIARQLTYTVIIVGFLAALGFAGWIESSM